MTGLLDNPPAGVSIQRMPDLHGHADAATASVGDLVNELSDAIRAGVVGAAGAVQFTAGQFATLARLVGALDDQALVAHSAVEDIAEAYSKGVR